MLLSLAIGMRDEELFSRCCAYSGGMMLMFVVLECALFLGKMCHHIFSGCDIRYISTSFFFEHVQEEKFLLIVIINGVVSIWSCTCSIINNLRYLLLIYNYEEPRVSREYMLPDSGVYNRNDIVKSKWKMCCASFDRLYLLRKIVAMDQQQGPSLRVDCSVCRRRHHVSSSHPERSFGRGRAWVPRITDGRHILVVFNQIFVVSTVAYWRNKRLRGFVATKERE